MWQLFLNCLCTYNCWLIQFLFYKKTWWIWNKNATYYLSCKYTSNTKENLLKNVIVLDKRFTKRSLINKFHFCSSCCCHAPLNFLPSDDLVFSLQLILNKACCYAFFNSRKQTIKKLIKVVGKRHPHTRKKKM